MTAKKTYPFMDFDYTKFMADFKMPGMDMKMPGMDVTGVVEYQKKNLEAMTAANKVALEGIQAVAQRQAELLKSAVDEMTATTKALAEAGAENPVDAAVKQTETFKKSLSDAQANMKELLEMVSKSQDEAGSILNSRFNEALDEMKAALGKMGK